MISRLIFTDYGTSLRVPPPLSERQRTASVNEWAVAKWPTSVFERTNTLAN